MLYIHPDLHSFQSPVAHSQKQRLANIILLNSRNHLAFAKFITHAISPRRLTQTKLMPAAVENASPMPYIVAFCAQIYNVSLCETLQMHVYIKWTMSLQKSAAFKTSFSPLNPHPSIQVVPQLQFELLFRRFQECGWRKKFRTSGRRWCVPFVRRLNCANRQQWNRTERKRSVPVISEVNYAGQAKSKGRW